MWTWIVTVFFASIEVIFILMLLSQDMANSVFDLLDWIRNRFK